MTALTSELTDLERYASALDSMPRDTVLSHRSAAVVWGLWIPPFHDVEVTTPARGAGSRYTTSVQRTAVVAHRRILPPDDLTIRHGLLVTDLVRTWLDLAPLLDIYDLVAAGDRALQLGASRPEMLQRCAALRRLRGIRRSRMAARVLHPDSRSRPESRIRAALVLAGLPVPEVNQPIFDELGQWLAEPDLHYKAARLAIEYNGSDHATLERMRKDATRTLDMQRADWLVRIYTAIDAFRPGAACTRALDCNAPAPPYRAQRVTTSDDQRRLWSRL